MSEPHNLFNEKKKINSYFRTDQSIDDYMGSTSVGGDENTNSHFLDSIGEDLLELAKDLSSSSSMFDESNVSESTTHTNVFNTTFMQQTVAYFAGEAASEFSIAEYLSPDLIEHERLTESCSCCLCQLRHKNGCALDVCVRNHPDAVRCQRLRTNNAVCSACMDSMILISNQTKAKHYRCIDDSCAEVLKTKASLRNHYLKHLKCKMYTCDFCSKTYNSIRALKTHGRSHAK